MNAYVYILRCSDGKYYTGSARGSLERRVWEHKQGKYPGFTSRRRPVELVFAEYFENITDAIAAERRIKGWTRAKKEALIRGDYGELKRLASRSSAAKHPSRRR